MVHWWFPYNNGPNSVTNLPPTEQSGLTISTFEKSGSPPLPSRLDQSSAVGLMVVLSFTALAHGAVDPWSIAIFELMLIGILLLWGIKITVDRRLDVNIPPAALPILALLLLGIVQSIAFTGGDGQRWSLSMDVEATPQTPKILFFLALALLVAFKFLVYPDRPLLPAHSLT